MKRSLAKHFAILTLGIAGALVVSSNGKADYLPWGGGCCGSTYTAGYVPTYTGYFPSYYGAGYYGDLYGVGYYAGYYPLAYGANYYGSGCCGGCGSPCGSWGCGSGCGAPSCGSFGCSSCGTGCCGAPLACSGGCGCGPSGCGSGLACADGCGCASGTASGSGCNGAAPSGPAIKKPKPTADDGFEPRGSPTYDDTPAPRKPRKAPLNPPETGAGANGPPGATGTDGPPNGEPAATGGYKRNQGADPGSPGAPKGQTNESPEFKPPTTPPKGSGSTPPTEAQPFGVNKPVTPAPPKQSGKKAPITNLPDAGSTDNVQNRSTAAFDGNGSDLTRNPALGLQERATWSYSTTRHTTVGRIASTTGPTPQRLRFQTGEWAAAPIEAKVVRN
jgi:hypothetical protein